MSRLPHGFSDVSTAYDPPAAEGGATNIALLFGGGDVLGRQVGTALEVHYLLADGLPGRGAEPLGGGDIFPEKRNHF